MTSRTKPKTASAAVVLFLPSLAPSSALPFHLPAQPAWALGPERRCWAGTECGTQPAAHRVYRRHRAFSSMFLTREAGSRAHPPPRKMTAMPSDGGWKPWSWGPHQKSQSTRKCSKNMGGVEAGFRVKSDSGTPTGPGEARCSRRPPLRNSHKNKGIHQHGSGFRMAETLQPGGTLGTPCSPLTPC